MVYMLEHQRGGEETLHAIIGEKKSEQPVLFETDITGSFEQNEQARHALMQSLRTVLSGERAGNWEQILGETLNNEDEYGMQLGDPELGREDLSKLERVRLIEAQSDRGREFRLSFYTLGSLPSFNRLREYFSVVVQPSLGDDQTGWQTRIVLTPKPIEEMPPQGFAGLDPEDLLKLSSADFDMVVNEGGYGIDLTARYLREDMGRMEILLWTNAKQQKSLGAPQFDLDPEEKTNYRRSIELIGRADSNRTSIDERSY